MRDIQTAAVKEIRDFLSMPAIAENMTDLVRKLLVYSELDTNEQVVADVLADDLILRKHVVICGTAGSGKTELLFRVLEALRSKGVATTDLGEKDTANFASGTVAYVTDLSGMGEESVSKIADAIAGGATIVVAGNEGVLHWLRSIPQLSAVKTRLHKLQSGGTGSDREAPIVVDLGGLSRIGGVTKLLTASAIIEAAREDECGDRKCLRNRSIDLLQHPHVVGAIDELLKLAFQGEQVHFRAIYNYVADLLLGGSCIDGTSPWFYRMFFGSSHLAHTVTQTLWLSELLLPEVATLALSGRWSQLSVRMSALPTGTSEGISSPRREVDELCKLIEDAAEFPAVTRTFVSEKLSLSLAAITSAIVSMPGRVSSDGGAVPQLIELIHSYLQYRSEDAGVDASALDLWFEPAIKRGVKRSIGALTLGTVSANDFVIRQSSLVSGDTILRLRGTRQFLVLSSENQSAVGLELQPSLVHSLKKGRSIRTADRSTDEADLALARFFAGVQEHAIDTAPGQFKLFSEDRWGPPISKWKIPLSDDVNAIVAVS
jgi:hypothetical protein